MAIVLSPAHTGVPTRHRVQLHVVITLADVGTVMPADKLCQEGDLMYAVIYNVS